MAKKNKKSLGFPEGLIDPNIPLEHRIMMLGHLCIDDSDQAKLAAAALLNAAENAIEPGAKYEKGLEQVAAKLRSLEAGPLRPATYVHTVEGDRACVMLEDGSSAYVYVPDDDLRAALRCGDTVLTDVQGKALLLRVPGGPTTGDELSFHRRLDDRRIEVEQRGERLVVWAADELARQIRLGDVEPGRMLLTCTRRRIAFSAVPADDGLSSYRYLAREPVPDVHLDRDLGVPPRYVDEVAQMVRQEMVCPSRRRRYLLNRCLMKLLAGPTGTGKTYSFLALWRRIYEVMAEVTGVPIEALPPRVLRLRMSEVLSKWVGESDKNIDRFFDEAEQLAAERFRGPDGTDWELPVLCILEEVDGLARTRGHDSIHDRILTTPLQRLDTSHASLRNQFSVWIATTNVPEQVDAAFVRRIGGTIEHFGRLDRRSLVTVLDRRLGERPVAGSDAAARRELIARVTAWLYPPKREDAPQVELSFAGSTTWERRYRRDLLTPALVERAVQRASDAACRAPAADEQADGLTATLLIEAFTDQFRGLVDQLRESNVRDYLDLPDGVRIAALRRPRRPVLEPVQLERTA